MYNFYKTNNSKGILLSYNFNGKELILFIGNFFDDDYYSDEERSIGLYGDKRPLICNNVLNEFDVFKKTEKEEFQRLIYKWFIYHLGINSEKASYIQSAMMNWGIYN